MAEVVQDPDALDLSAGYTPLPAQRRFHEATEKARLYSGGFGSGKSVCGCREAIVTAFLYPGSAGLIARLRMRDLELTTQKTFWEQLTMMGLNRKPYVKKWSAKLNTLTLLNGSEIIFSGLDDEMKLRSMQLSWAYVDEGSEVPVHMYRTLMGRIRWGKPRRMWVTTNPGASGWLRTNFIDQTRKGYHVTHAPTVENVHLPQDYIDSLLEEYPDVWRKRYLEGSWDAFEGQVFTMADPAVHLYDGDWRPTPEHIIYESYDFGWRNPTHVCWTAWHPSGEEPLVTFAEHAASEWTVDRHVGMIRTIREHHGLREDQIISFGDPAGAQVQGLTGMSYFDEYAAHGIGISPSTKEPSIRALRIAKLLEKRNYTRHGGEEPGWVFLKKYTQRTWASLIAYRYKLDRGTTGEDPKEQYHKEGDHGVDALGYGIMAIPLQGEKQVTRKAFPMQATKPRRPEDDEYVYDEVDTVSMYGMTV